MIERKILIGLITSPEYVIRIKNQFSAHLLEDATAKRMAMWCIDYFEKYSNVPGKQIETIFYEKAKNGLPKDLAEEIEEDILPGLSEEYESDGLNVDFLVDETQKYLESRHLTLHHEKINGLLLAGKLDEAKQEAAEYKPLGFDTGVCIVKTVEQIQADKRPRPKLLMFPWLRESETNVIIAEAGVGKSLLTMAVCSVLSLEDFSAPKCDFGDWQPKRGCGTLYLDGEMGGFEFVDRMMCFRHLGRVDYPMQILSRTDIEMETEKAFCLSKPEVQQQIIKWLDEHPDYKICVIDSLSTLFDLIDENNASEFAIKVHPFFRALRALGVAQILLHHTGKNVKNGGRGTSALTTMAQNIFLLKAIEGPEVEEASFEIKQTKKRSAGKSFQPFEISFTLHEKKNTYWEVLT